MHLAITAFLKSTWDGIKHLSELSADPEVYERFVSLEKNEGPLAAMSTNIQTLKRNVYESKESGTRKEGAEYESAKEPSDSHGNKRSNKRKAGSELTPEVYIYPNPTSPTGRYISYPASAALIDPTPLGGDDRDEFVRSRTTLDAFAKSDKILYKRQYDNVIKMLQIGILPYLSMNRTSNYRNKQFCDQFCDWVDALLDIDSRMPPKEDLPSFKERREARKKRKVAGSTTNTRSTSTTATDSDMADIGGKHDGRGYNSNPKKDEYDSDDKDSEEEANQAVEDYGLKGHCYNCGTKETEEVPHIDGKFCHKSCKNIYTNINRVKM